MQDFSFLPNLSDEDIYVIEEDKAVEKVKEVMPQPVVAAVIAPTPAPASVTAPENIVEEPLPVFIQPLPTEGNNLKHCIIIVESDEAILNKDSKTFLENILKSVKRSPDDILLVNAKEATDEQIQALLVEQNHRHLLCFGTEKMTNLNSIQNYTVHSENHKFYLKADDLSIISQAVEKKKALWIALKEMFL